MTNEIPFLTFFQLCIARSTFCNLFVHFQVTLESLSEGTSGLINSDWHVLKFNGYMVEKTMEPKGKDSSASAGD